MGKFTDALKKAAEKRMERVEKKEDFKPYVVRTVSDSKIDPHVVAYFDPTSPVSEQYRIMRTNLLALDKKNPPKIVAVTSAIHGEGKTITSINLAITFANDLNKKSILLVDADLRKATMTRDLGLHAENGLTQVLSEGLKLEDALLSIGIKNLHILPAGKKPSNPAELLGSQEMRDLIAKVRKEYDFVLFDSPPVVPVADSAILGAQCDGVLMILQAGRTQRGAVLHSQDRLSSAKVHILGYCMTNIEYHIPEYIYRYL